MRDWPLVGRDFEMRSIAAHARDPDVSAVVITGAAGAGRTRLVREALALAGDGGMRTEWVAASRCAASIPFGAVAHLLPEKWVPRPDAALAALRAVAARFRRWGGRPKVALGVDDAHLLDDSSAAAVAYLAQHRLALVLLSARSDDPIPDSVVRLWRDGDGRLVELSDLPDAAVDHLVDAALPGQVDGLCRHALRRLAGGNPLVLSELLHGGKAGGTLRQRYGVWCWDGPAPLPVRSAGGAQAVSAVRPDLSAAEPPPPGAIRARWACARAEVLCSQGGDPAAVERVLDLAADGPDADLVAATRAWVVLLGGDCGRALGLARRIIARPGSSEQAMVTAATAGTVAAGFLGRFAESEYFLRRGCGDAGAVGSGGPVGSGGSVGSGGPVGMAGAAGSLSAEPARGPNEIGYGVCLAALAAGEIERAWRIAEDGYRAAVEAFAAELAGRWIGLRGLVEATAGLAVTASASLREAAAATERDDPFGVAGLCRAALARAVAGTGDAASAAEWLDRAEGSAGASCRLFLPWIELHRAWALAATSTRSAAVRAARRAVDLAVAMGAPIVEAVARYDVVRLGGTIDLAALTVLCTDVGSPFTHALAAAASGLVNGDGDGLARASGAFAALGHHLLAAETSAAASRVYRRDGRRASAAVYQERSTALRARCEGTATPLLGPDVVGELLSPREREIVLLAIDHPSRHIAQRLGLSVRTVDNNLARAYAKLGVSGRAAVRALLHPAGTG
jgi:DNA-binding CsgD family transcriptional regulator